jgi:predicted nucleotidyltransferase
MQVREWDKLRPWTDRPHTHNMTEAFLRALAEWARESAMLAVAVVGSYARGTARADSDVDLVLLVANPERFFASADWIKRFGEICSFRDEDWGRLRSRRVYYVSGLEVEFGFSDAAWAITEPVDPGTKTVVDGGLLCVYDPQSVLRLLKAAMQSSGLIDIDS